MRLSEEDIERIRKAFQEFDDAFTITDIILLGMNGEIRRINFNVEEKNGFS